ncbi:MAG: zinc ribbon domain-containing protein [Thermodesulfobacteriota bacterium]
MPIYEFYCDDCNTIFNFFSKRINTTKKPACPKCNKRELKRQMSTFSTLSGTKEEADGGMPDIDESKLEKAMGLLESEAGKINEDDPKQAANLMRQFSEMTGMNLGSKMEEALDRMEAGEDPDQIEAEMGDMMDDETPFTFDKKTGKRVNKSTPKKDDTLYDLD